MFRRLRIAILLIILAIAALTTWTDSLYTRNWKGPLVVALYPINGDGSAAADRYIEKLTPDDSNALQDFFQREAEHFGIKLDRPLRFTLAPRLNALPPLPPGRGNTLQIIGWSLRLRWWAWQTPPKPPGPTPRIKMFLLYHDPARIHALEHSTGLSKGLIGIAQLFADTRMNGSNNVVIAHELLHTLSATDKYDLETTLPMYPQGFAEPDAQPRYPQRYAELMAGRIAISPNTAKIPESLDEVVIGDATANEIGWSR